jgi:hypothetical protein
MKTLTKILFIFFIYYLSAESSFSKYHNPLPNSQYIQSAQLHKKGAPITVTGQSNFGETYKKLKDERGQISKLGECQCIPTFSRSLDKTTPRSNMRDVADSISCKIISLFQNKEKQKIIFWGSGRLLNELTIIMHLLERGISNFDIYIYDSLYEHYKNKDNQHEIIEKIKDYKICDLEKLGFEFKEETDEEEIDRDRDKLLSIFNSHNKSIEQFIKYLEKIGFKNSINVFYNKDQIKDITFDYAFALDSFIKYIEPFIIEHNVISKTYFLMNKEVTDEEDTSIFEVCQVNIEEKSLTIVKRTLFIEIWKSKDGKIVEFKRRINKILY